MEEKKKKKPGCAENCLAFVLMIALIVFCIRKCDDKIQTSEKPEETKKTEQPEKIVQSEKPKDSGMDKIDVWCLVQEHVERRLVSPKSASFPFGGAQRHVECTAPGIFIVRSYVDAKNAFGAEIRQNFFAKVVKYENGKFEVIQLTFENPF